MFEIDIWLLVRLILTMISAIFFYKIYQFSRWNGFLFFVGYQIVNLSNRIILLTGIIDPEPFNTVSLMLSVILTVVGSYNIYVEFKKIFDGNGRNGNLNDEILRKNIDTASKNLELAQKAYALAKENFAKHANK